MKHRHGMCLLLGLTLAGVVFLGGFFAGRNWGSFPVLVSATPTVSESANAETAAAVPASQTVNINTATAEQLQTLPGIGPTLAQRILDYRAKNGSFASVAELANVEGIGIKRLESLLDYITTGG